MDSENLAMTELDRVAMRKHALADVVVILRIIVDLVAVCGVAKASIFWHIGELDGKFKLQ